jgi:2-polyprenyl-3-methyl-5-hydroxy-6-metoxy-1,4-benzoquinol methylase
LAPYNEDYLVCTHCGTLVSQVGLDAQQTQVASDEQDYYGKEYWLSHQSGDLGLPNIQERARLDLPERCLYWLQTLLSFKLPPARVLEVGCSHGGFVALLRWTGFDATGLEVSPWVVDYARKTFDIPMLLGGIEEQHLPEQSFDAVVLNDVLEHLPDPLGTLHHCVRLLKPDGMLLLQTPDYPDEKTYAEVTAERLPFLVYLDNKAVTIEHLYVFSKRAVRHLCRRLDCGEVCFETPIFPSDMFFSASKCPLPRHNQDQIDRCLEANTSRRLVQALLHLRSAPLEILAQWRKDHDKAERDIHTLHDLLRSAHQANREVTARLTNLLSLGPFALGVARKVHRVARRVRAAQTRVAKMKSSLKRFFRKAG